VFRNAVAVVPLILSKDAAGSAVLIQTKGPLGYLVTNQHVVKSPFVDANGRPVVVAIFYDARLARDVLDFARVDACLTGHDQTSWCGVVRDATRYCAVIRSDVGTLLLLSCRMFPPGRGQFRRVSLAMSIRATRWV
jgi:hypothetical protein